MNNNMMKVIFFSFIASILIFRYVYRSLTLSLNWRLLVFWSVIILEAVKRSK